MEAFRGVSLRVLALSGSLRAQSLNTLLLREAARLAPPGMTFTFWERLDDLPHFSPERDIDPLPAPLTELRGLIHQMVHGSSLCLTLARSGLDEAGHLKDPAQGAALGNALNMLLLSMEGS